MSGLVPLESPKVSASPTIITDVKSKFCCAPNDTRDNTDDGFGGFMKTQINLIL